MIKLAPSVLAADPMNMGADVEKVLSAGADWIHLDIMDAHFVPNLSFSPAFCAALHKRFPDTFIDAHLMMDNPEKYVDAFFDAGASAVTIHVEIEGDVCALLKKIRARGMSGISLRPGTPLDAVKPYLEYVDLVLVMSVEPGFGGQKFMADQMDKVKALRDMGYRGRVSVDGGVNMENAQYVIRSGADVIVMGTAIFKAEDPKRVVADFRGLE